ncbi:hypothetical protein UFOVP75_5 [uncultured Caudovirales phage]|uniref:Uncharacterized protein n=1 Tax=uncultured Caudovirales phage TaxID=2100421 RepID=A0A6J5KVJ2_9CAUD|nr:hypothetical protein UFOVP75_5 [uncultured Caudovirales phage]
MLTNKNNLCAVNIACLLVACERSGTADSTTTRATIAACTEKAISAVQEVFADYVGGAPMDLDAIRAEVMRRQGSNVTE